jgi:hypothetical protein
MLRLDSVRCILHPWSALARRNSTVSEIGAGMDRGQSSRIDLIHHRRKAGGV